MAQKGHNHPAPGGRCVHLTRCPQLLGVRLRVGTAQHHFVVPVPRCHDVIGHTEVTHRGHRGPPGRVQGHHTDLLPPGFLLRFGRPLAQPPPFIGVPLRVDRPTARTSRASPWTGRYLTMAQSTRPWIRSWPSLKRGTSERERPRRAAEELEHRPEIPNSATHASRSRSRFRTASSSGHWKTSRTQPWTPVTARVVQDVCRGFQGHTTIGSMAHDPACDDWLTSRLVQGGAAR